MSERRLMIALLLALAAMVFMWLDVDEAIWFVAITQTQGDSR